MWHKKEVKPSMQQPVKDTLIIIGNGFDIWQGIDTQYENFRLYYLKHRDEIMKKLRIKKHLFICETGEKIFLSDVELIYGDPFSPDELPHTFWNTFETSLADIDAEQLNYFFGKKRSDLRAMKKSIRNAERILKEAFYNWIASLAIPEKKSDFEFGENCLFINFNYTDTLQKQFDVNPSDVFHIHGEATDKTSIVVGHSSHPQQPEPFLKKLKGRFQGLYLVGNLLYETDKHVHEQQVLLSCFFSTHTVFKEDIKQIYVLGHSVSPVDLDYFIFLFEATSVLPTENDATKAPQITDSTEALSLRINYAIQKTGYGIPEDEISNESLAAIQQQLAAENEEINEHVDNMMFKRLKKTNLQIPMIPQRAEDAIWHFSYYSDRDKQRLETLMKDWHCQHFTLYPSIDQCLAPFKRK